MTLEKETLLNTAPVNSELSLVQKVYKYHPESPIPHQVFQLTRNVELFSRFYSFQ